MQTLETFNRLSKFVSQNALALNEPMAQHTSFKVGGCADIFVQPASRTELTQVIADCRQHSVPYIVLGRATNVIIPDDGLRMVVIQLFPNYGGYSLSEETCGDFSQSDKSQKTTITANAGMLLTEAANIAMKNSLTGLEFAAGIPGTVGGAICMNAGAYEHDISEICTAVDLLMPNGEITTFSASQLNFGYRTSVIQKNGGIVLSATFSLNKGEKSAIKATMIELNQRRNAAQPIEFPSAGSIFKRPPEHFAGKLIADSGLKGVAIGGACVSEKHAGFIINTGNATAQNITDLMQHVQAVVKNNYGVHLEPEVKILCNL
ncbi:MAG: UDP-N-acetylmuramate dehydrogenase [Defluviitaleaceae bacterium]|nr:UDP-N-acetylmuramate dehydrogenase [Defluviitaleaceae bacterium]